MSDHRATTVARTLPLAVMAVMLAAAGARGDTLTVGAAADNTMYNEAGNQSNGAGNSFFAGRTDNSELRRALIRFDLTAIPVDSTVNV